MNIVILDGYAENPGDLSWEWLKKLGNLTVYDRTPADKIRERVLGHEIVITNKTPLNKEILSEIKELKYIGLLSTGYNVVDWEYCKSKGIPVCNIPTYSTSAVAQLTFAHILEHTNHVGIHSDSVRNGDWSRCADFCYWKTPLIEVAGKTLGIIGYGKIGKAVAAIAASMGMKVLVSTRHPGNDENVDFVDRDTLIETSDFITIHCPLTPETTGMVDSEFLNKMKRTAYLINTSRGPVINENDLAEALNNHVIAGASLDVMCKEPPEADNPLLSCNNCNITPHIAWAGYETRVRLMDICRKNIESFLDGKIINCVY